MFGPVITTEAHLAFAGATAEMSAMIEALSFFGLHLRSRVFIMTPNMLLVFAWARFKPAHMSSWHLRATSRC